MDNDKAFSTNFILVLIGQVISLFGNQVLRYALPLYLLYQTGSSALFGTIMAGSFVPMILLFPLGGILADRVHKKRIMVSLDFSTAALMFLFCLLADAVAIVPLMMVTMMLLYGIQGVYQPAVKASVPALVDAAHIITANTVVDLINSLSGMAGPVIGGILFSAFGLMPVLYVTIGCFLISALMELFITIPFERQAVSGGLLATGLGDLKESFRFVFQKQPVLWKLSFVYASIGLLLTSLVLIGVPVLISQHLGFSPESAGRLYGYAQGTFAAGAILGGLLAGLSSKKLKAQAGPLLLTGCALSILLGGMALQFLTNGLEIYCILLTASATLIALSTVLQIQMMSYIQILTPRELTGKVISCVICICMCTNPMGQFLYGIVFEAEGMALHMPFYLAALMMAAVSVAARPVFGEIGGMAV